MALALAADTLIFRFPEIHEDAILSMTFQRTLRVPDDGHDHWLPPGLGAFPVRDLTSFGDRVPAAWRARGGVALPMWQAEAMWLNFSSPMDYPMAVKVAAGKVNALTGKPWQDALDFEEQDYMEIPAQPWLDGFCVTKGVVKQFVAMPLGRGYTVEEQLTGEAEFGGLQILVRPLKGEIWEARKRAEAKRSLRSSTVMSEQIAMSCASPVMSAMGLGAGGSIRQEIVEATESPKHWAPMTTRERCFVHLVNSTQWEQLAGSAPPGKAPSAADYSRAGLPWFDWYSDRPAIDGGTRLRDIQTVLELGFGQQERPLDENESFPPQAPHVLGKKATGTGSKDGVW